MDSLTNLGNNILWGLKKVKSECGKAIDTCPVWEQKPKSKSDTSGAESAKIKGTNDLKRLEKMYYPDSKSNKRADAGWTEDIMTFSSEALALRA